MLSELIFISLSILEISIFGYFFYVSTYNLLFSLFGLKRTKTHAEGHHNLNKVAILIPAYKEDQVIIQTVNMALKMDYPIRLFKVIVVADSLNEITLSLLRDLPIVVHEVNFQHSTKVKAIKSVLENVELDVDFLIILDADNHVERDFLNKANDLYATGHQLVQGRRLIKNQVNQLTFLDDLSEQINNHINRKGATNMGASSSIAGSGFFVSLKLGKRIFMNLSSIGGFDKEFEIVALENGVKTVYNENLVIYDEKVESQEIFRQQRKRWISSQYSILRKYLKHGMNQLMAGNFVSFNSSVLRYLQLPRFINLVLFTLLIIVILLFKSSLIFPISLWLLVYLSFLISILIAIPKRFYSFRLLASLLYLPSVFVSMTLILFKLKGANKSFIHTPHSYKRNKE